MSDPLAHYSFLPWLRQGIGTRISDVDAKGAPTSGMATERAELEVGLTLESTDVNDGTPITSDLDRTVKMIGPPDILAISTNAIVRVEPKPKVNNYEANGLPYIEFYEEDFPWRYSPAVAGTGADAGKLTPWLALICLRDDEFELKNSPDGRASIVIPTEKIDAVFHDPTQHWAWAHVHLNTELEASDLNGRMLEVNSELEANPDSGVARLLCPRKLLVETQYTAFLIPAFETGRRAGLGADFSGVLAQELSWGSDPAAKPRGAEYPVYHHWTFRTGRYGDFESLARILKPVVTDPELGKRDMFIAEAGYGLEDTPPDSTVLGLEGALKPPDFVSDAWTNGSGDVAYREHLRKLLNLSIDNEKRQTNEPAVAVDSLTANPFYSATLGDDPIVTPPIYGRWHGLVDRLRTGFPSNAPWVNDLNLDPRNRATAGLGTTVVQKNQEDYMRRAWKQVEEIKEANKRIQRAALSRMISHAIYRKHIRYANTDMAVRLTSPMHRFVTDSGRTVQHLISRSLIPNASKGGAFKKVTRPGKKSIRKMNAVAITGANTIHRTVVQNFNSETVKAAKDKEAPPLAIDIATVSSAITVSLANYQANDTAMAQQGVFDALLTETSFSDLQTSGRKNQLKDKINANDELNTDAKRLARDLIDGIESSVDGGTTASHNIVVLEAPFKAVFGTEITAKSYQNIIISRDTAGQPGVLGRATLLQDLGAYNDAFTVFNTSIIGTLASIPKADPIANIGQFSSRITAFLQPKQQLLHRVASAITLNVFDELTGTYQRRNIDRLRPIMAYPKFDDPMFRNLKELSQEYILPNIDKVPINSITLLETNQAFIEAYMAGLNHEMSRELLWREFPTDQRGSYFRQFWDISDNIFETNRERKYDIKKMHTWDDELGKHTPRVITNPSGSRYLVLLIRGELLKKYPNTQVYAQQAEFKNTSNPSAPRRLSDDAVEANIKLPVFMAELDPDIYLFGFDLDIDEAKGDSSDASKPGWFFVLRERPGQIRFGLDDWTPVNPDDPVLPTGDPTDWNDLSWEHLVESKEALEAYQIDAQHSFAASSGSANTPRATWGKNAADMAYILYQNPVLFARHAQEMLPD